MSSIKILGHTPPDTDTVCSPIIYSWFLNEHKAMDTVPVRAGEINKETEFVLDYFGIPVSENIENLTSEDKVIIVDTNNPEELVTGWQDATILGIVDHHKLVGGLMTSDPINITTRTVGCSATILWEIINRDGDVEVPENIQGLILACIVSDTLKFSSPTTTDQDRKVAEIVADQIEMNIDELAEKMFDAKSSLDGYTPADIIKIDSKVFPMADKRIRISVLETVRPSLSLDMKDELKKEMLVLKNTEGLDDVFFFVVDILRNEATAVVYDDNTKNTIEEAFDIKFNSEDFVVLKGVVSRKKQIVPNIENAINGQKV
jgi:manganese-dependent inorganic pyrophosphatase